MRTTSILVAAIAAIASTSHAVKISGENKWSEEHQAMVTQLMPRVKDLEWILNKTYSNLNTILREQELVENIGMKDEALTNTLKTLNDVLSDVDRQKLTWSRDEIYNLYYY